MRWLPVLLVLVSLKADARPVRPVDLDDLHRTPPRCPATNSWQRFTRCQLKHLTFELLRDLPAAKLIAVGGSGGSARKRLTLFLLAGTQWVESSFRGDVTATSELLAFTKLASDTYRVDVGHASPTWVTLDEVTQRPAVLRRAVTHVCVATSGCRQTVTACEVLVNGKAIAGYRGEPVWDGNSLKLRADVRNTNRYCIAPRNLVD